MAEVGLAARNGASLAVDDINAAGGIGGRRLALVARDDRGDAAYAAKADAELVAEGVVAIVGHLTSTLSFAARPTAEAAGVTVVSPWASSSALLEPGSKFFMLFSPSDEEAVAAAGHAFVHSGRNAFVVYDADNAAYTERWKEVFGETFARLGGRIAGFASFRSSDARSLFSAAATAAGSGAAAIAIAADVLDAAMLCQRIRMAGCAARLYISNWAMARDFIANGGTAVEGVVVFSNIDQRSSDPRSSAFRAAYEKRFGTSPIDVAYLGYECVSVIADALRAARSASGLGRAIVDSSPHRGLQGDISFSDGAPLRPLNTFVVRDGAFVAEGRYP
jgi:branched-chain amino acid transport system substrate-binding protein